MNDKCDFTLNRLNRKATATYIAVYINADNEVLRSFWVKDHDDNEIINESEARQSIEETWQLQKMENVDKIYLLYYKYAFGEPIGEAMCYATVQADDTLKWHFSGVIPTGTETYMPGKWKFKRKTITVDYLYCCGKYPMNEWQEKVAAKEAEEQADKERIYADIKRIMRTHADDGEDNIKRYINEYFGYDKR